LAYYAIVFLFHASVFNLLREKPCSFAHSGRISIS
jgi:hypothetical protein